MPPADPCADPQLPKLDRENKNTSHDLTRHPHHAFLALKIPKMDDSALGDALFSPSKAAQQRAQAHDWQHVEAWLSSLYPNRALPTFERNEETLKALLELAAANERADEEATMVVALEEEVRHEMSEVRAMTTNNVVCQDQEADGFLWTRQV